MVKLSLSVSLGDEIEIMEIRVINFSEEKCPPDLAPYWYEVTLGPTRQQMISLTPNITDMISQAMMSEWKHALGLLNKQTNILVLTEKYPDFMQWIDHIAEKGPSAVLQNKSDSFPNFVTDPYDRVNDRHFVGQARAIVTRKTVFLLPDSSPSCSALYQADKRDEFVGSLSALLGAGNTSIALAKSVHKADSGDSIFHTVMAFLFARNSQLRMDEDTGIHIKPGPLLIEGDTGTGKSAAAKHLAVKMGKAMVEINLAAVSETLLETRMRGSTKGAFTDATNKKGFFEEAHNGVLFLDELQSASLASQTQLLDLLSAISNDVWISKVGEDAAKKKYDVKVVLAVNEPVSRLLAEGRLRRDLFHRIRDVVRFKSLNELFAQDNASALLAQILTLYRWRSFELPAFAGDGKAKQALPQLFTVYEEGVIEKILSAPWPGNFRQMERFAWDLFFVLGERTQVSNDLIDRLLKEEANRIPASFIGTEPTYSKQSRIVREAERIIKKNGFNLKASLPELKESCRLGTHPTLNKFIREHKDQFSESFLADSKITKIITSAASALKSGQEHE